MKTSKSLCFGDLSFKYTKNSEPKLGLIVSTKCGNATERNLFKRRCRSAFKSTMVDNSVNYAVIVRPKKPGVSFRNIQESFNAIYDQFSD